MWWENTGTGSPEKKALVILANLSICQIFSILILLIQDIFTMFLWWDVDSLGFRNVWWNSVVTIHQMRAKLFGNFMATICLNGDFGCCLRYSGKAVEHDCRRVFYLKLAGVRKARLLLTYPLHKFLNFFNWTPWRKLIGLPQEASFIHWCTFTPA